MSGEGIGTRPGVRRLVLRFFFCPSYCRCWCGTILHASAQHFTPLLPVFNGLPENMEQNMENEVVKQALEQVRKHRAQGEMHAGGGMEADKGGVRERERA